LIQRSSLICSTLFADRQIQPTVRIRQARVDINGRDTIVPTKTERSARELPLPPRELAMLKAMRTVHVRERLAVRRPMAEDDLLLSRADSTWLPVREYSREFAVQRRAAGLKAITLAKLRHSNISRMRAAGRGGRRGRRLAWPYRADDAGGVRARHRRPPHRRRDDLLARDRT
jgi:hypothetical protein